MLSFMVKYSQKSRALTRFGALLICVGLSHSIYGASTPPKVTVLGPALQEIPYYQIGGFSTAETVGVYLAKQSASRVAWAHHGSSPANDPYIKVWTRSNQAVETVAADLSLDSGKKLQLGGISGDGDVIVGTIWTPVPLYNDVSQPFTWTFGNDPDDLNLDFDNYFESSPIRGAGANLDGSFVGIQLWCDECQGSIPQANLYEIGSGVEPLYSGDRESVPFAINADATAVVGWRVAAAEAPKSPGRSGCRTAAGGASPYIWDSTNGEGWVTVFGAVEAGTSYGLSWTNGTVVGFGNCSEVINGATVLGSGFRASGTKDLCGDYIGTSLLPLHLDTYTSNAWSFALDQGTDFAVGQVSNGFFPAAVGLSGGSDHAVWWDVNAIPYDLNEVFACYMPNSGTQELVLTAATSIANDDRAIAGLGLLRTRPTSGDEWGDPSPVAWFIELESCPGDLNYDGYVDDADFVLLLASYNNLTCPEVGDGCCLPGDLNWNRTVDDADFVLFGIGYSKLICE